MYLSVYVCVLCGLVSKTVRPVSLNFCGHTSSLLGGTYILFSSFTDLKSNFFSS